MTKKSKLYTKFFATGIVFLTLSLCITSGVALNGDFTFDLDEFKLEIQDLPDEYWKKPAQNRKDTICNKLTALQDLINEGNFEEAYDKLLYDIKPKLTGLKEDENEEPWGNGDFKQAWVTCEGLRETFNTKCNLILAEINPQSVYDDDKTPPEISIIYEGVQYVGDPGVWNVEVGDIESGLDKVKIEINDIVEINDINLIDIFALTYVIPVPAIEGINTIVVSATNNDKDFVGDQETSTESEWVEIYADFDPPIIDHPDDLQYLLGSTGNTITWITTDENPDTYTVSLDCAFYERGEWESGMPIIINIDSLSIGTYEFTIRVYDTLENFIDDAVLVNVYEADDTSPVILMQYDGSNVVDDPGDWKVLISDEESGLGEIHITLSFGGQIYYEIQENLGGMESNFYTVPLLGIEGTHFLTVIAKNDITYDGVQETNSIIDEPLEIGPYQPPVPGDEDDTAPNIDIRYDGNYVVNSPGEWTVYLWDYESGLGEIYISLSFAGEIYYEIQVNLGGTEDKFYIVPVQGIEGTHFLTVIAKNDIAYDGVQETNSIIDEPIDIGPYVPPEPT